VLKVLLNPKPVCLPGETGNTETASCVGSSGAILECRHCGDSAEERGAGGMEAVHQWCWQYRRTSSEVSS